MENLNLVKPEKVQNIINKFCYTIGMIPTSYKISLTYEEQIIAIGKYLEETVIPALNNNAEAVVELQSLFIQLKDYVENFFDDLNIQNEINNKLDQMAQDGTLEQIINENIFNDLNNKINKCVYTFYSFNDMINCEFLKENDMVRTLGFETPFDGGKSIYIITNNVVDNLYNYKLLNGKTATKQIEEKTNILSFGIKPLTNISSKINKILEKEKTIEFNKGTYLINFDFRMLPKSNSLIIGNNTIIKIEGSYDATYYAMCEFTNVSNITIKNITFDGSKANNVQNSGNGGHCIVVNDSKNINIINCTLKNAWYDGILIDNYSKLLDDITIIDNCIFDGVRRNGISITSSPNTKITNCKFQNITEELPMAGIDIEPYNINSSIIGNIIIDNCYFNNVRLAISNYLDKNSDFDLFNINVSNININNKNSSLDETFGLQCGYLNNSVARGNIKFENINISNTSIGLHFRDFNRQCPIYCNNITLDKITQLPIKFTNLYNWSTNYGSYYLNNIYISRCDNLENHVIFESLNENELAYRNIYINKINTHKIKGWNLLSNSKISNNLNKDITEEYTINFNEYYEQYTSKYPSPVINLPALINNFVNESLPINIYCLFGYTKLKGENIKPAELVTENQLILNAYGNITLFADRNNWIIKNIIGKI